MRLRARRQLRRLPDERRRQRQRRLTQAPAIDADPSWSPDGRKVTFESKDDGASAIYVIDADGREPRKLTDGSDPAWSPDGRKIAFERTGDIYVMQPDGKEIRRLTRGRRDDEFPGWLPARDEH